MVIELVTIYPNLQYHAGNLIIPSPHNIFLNFRDSGLEIKSFSYYKKDTKSLDFENMMKDIGQMEEGATILLHACAHNPTGVDPTAEQWDEISQVIARFLK